MTAQTLPRPGGVHRWWSGAGLLALLGLIALLTLGALPLVDEDEGEYSEVAAELAASGQWLAPTLNGAAFYEKPILLFWLQAPLVRAFGASEWVFRLPSLLCSVLWVLVLMHWQRRRTPAEPAALVTAWLAATGAGMVIAGRAATMDALLILLSTLTLLDVWRWLDGNGRAPLRRAALWAGLGVLAKGPVALIIPAGAVVLALLSIPTLRGRWRGLCDPWAWALLLVVALPWYAWYGAATQGEFLRYFLLRENAGRLQGSLQGHSGSLLYYLWVLPLLLLPHGGLLWILPPALRRAWTDAEQRFLLIWFLWVFALFSLAGTKLPHYLLYGCTPLFLIGGRALAGADGARTAVGLATLAASLLLPLLALCLPAVAASSAVHDGNPYIREMLARAPEVLSPSWQLRGWVWLGLALLAGLAGLRWRAHAPLRVLLPGLVSALGVSLVLLPAVTGLQQDPVRAAGRLAATLPGPVVSDNRMPSFSVYLGHASALRPLRPGDLAFGRIDHPDRLGARHDVLFAQGGIRLVRVVSP